MIEVRFTTIDEERVESRTLSAVPRAGEAVQLDGKAHRVTQVAWHLAPQVYVVVWIERIE